MSLRFRRFLYIFFILLFLALTPLVWLYAAGYKLRSGFKIEKTGMLVIETEPKGAKIYINNELKQQFLKKIFSDESGYITTPAKIKNLLPDKYDIRVEKNNYWPWEKKVEIESGKTAFFEDIRLFKNDLPQLLLEGKFDEALISPDKKYAVLKNKSKFVFLNIETEKSEDYLLSEPESSEKIGQTGEPWSWEGKKVLVNNLLFSFDNIQEPINIDTENIASANGIKWNAKDNDKIYYLNSEGIGRFDIGSQKKQLVIKNTSIFDYLPKDNLVYYLEKVNQSTILNVFDLGKNEIIAKINLPPYAYEFINPIHSLVNLYSSEYQTLYLIDPFSDYKPLADIISNIKEAHWINNEILLYHNDFEIWLFDLKTYNKTLLTRISSKINKIVWHPNNKYFIYSTDDNVNMLEIGDDKRCCSTKLIEAESIDSLSINEEGDTLYFQAKIKDKEGFYKLAI